jgi:Fe-S cluster assembly iron-binding protein IscA
VLTISQTAASALDRSRSQQGIPDDVTLRVAPAEQAPSEGLSLKFVDQPHDGDQTGTAHGLAFCVAPEVADALSDARIDVRPADDGAQLVIVPVG